MVSVDPIEIALVQIGLAVLLVSIFLKFFKQPYVIGYIIAGILIGPHGLSIFDDRATLSHLGSVGVTLLLFFIGMEVSVQRLIARWRIAILGTLFQVGLSVAVMAFFGYHLGWGTARVLLLGFVISLSSTVVIMKILQEKGEIDHDVGQVTLGILLVQDVLIVPMMIVLSFFSEGGVRAGEIVLQAIGGALLIGIAGYAITKEKLRLPLPKEWMRDHELQVFLALVLCFGFGTLAGSFGISTALGAFVAGLVVAKSEQTEWISTNLQPFRVIFVALFFISIGMLIDIAFIIENIVVIGLLVLMIFVINTVINVFVLRAFNRSWNESLYIGALLAQVGEFSFILAALGFQSGVIVEFGYQSTVAAIALSMLLSPLWIEWVRKVTGIRELIKAIPIPKIKIVKGRDKSRG